MDAEALMERVRCGYSLRTSTKSARRKNKLRRSGKVHVLGEERYLTFQVNNDGKLEVSCDNPKGQLYEESPNRDADRLLTSWETLGFVVLSEHIQRYLERTGRFSPEGRVAETYERSGFKKLAVF